MEDSLLEAHEERLAIERLLLAGYALEFDGWLVSFHSDRGVISNGMRIVRCAGVSATAFQVMAMKYADG